MVYYLPERLRVDERTTTSFRVIEIRTRDDFFRLLSDFETISSDFFQRFLKRTKVDSDEDHFLDDNEDFDIGGFENYSLLSSKLHNWPLISLLTAAETVRQNGPRLLLRPEMTLLNIRFVLMCSNYWLTR